MTTDKLLAGLRGLADTIDAAMQMRGPGALWHFRRRLRQIPNELRALVGDAQCASADQSAAGEAPSPTIVTLCGSTRFYREFQRANYEETMAGRIVLSVGFYWHASVETHGEQWGCTPEQKVALDWLHFRKIELSDEILVLNVGGYIGESTRNEIAHAKKCGKRIRYLEDAAGEAQGAEEITGSPLLGLAAEIEFCTTCRSKARQMIRILLEKQEAQGADPELTPAQEQAAIDNLVEQFPEHPAAGGETLAKFECALAWRTTSDLVLSRPLQLEILGALRDLSTLRAQVAMLTEQRAAAERANSMTQSAWEREIGWRQEAERRTREIEERLAAQSNQHAVDTQAIRAALDATVADAALVVADRERLKAQLATPENHVRIELAELQESVRVLEAQLDRIHGAICRGTGHSDPKLTADCVTSKVGDLCQSEAEAHEEVRKLEAQLAECAAEWKSAPDAVGMYAAITRTGLERELYNWHDGAWWIGAVSNIKAPWEVLRCFGPIRVPAAEGRL